MRLLQVATQMREFTRSTNFKYQLTTKSFNDYHICEMDCCATVWPLSILNWRM